MPTCRIVIDILSFEGEGENSCYVDTSAVARSLIRAKHEYFFICMCMIYVRAWWRDLRITGAYGASSATFQVLLHTDSHVTIRFVYTTNDLKEVFSLRHI